VVKKRKKEMRGKREGRRRESGLRKIPSFKMAANDISH
jgi:hypothetical protein